ncbi:MAG TPA: cytochrome ubiquinol oxidase subunit I [Candidatus Saccharimonadales bacterium]|nr:cytochrome ubiquinol oxidase subunit I [Candidatus Saccharimonadales bacterium]
MGFSLGWHIIIACFGVGLPGLVLFAEWRAHRTGDKTYLILAKRWAKVLGVLFAVGAVSGTIVSFEMGSLWAGLMSKYGEVIGLPFALEGFAFFVEAIFLAIYLYGWSKLSAKAHMWSAVPIVIAGIAGTFFVVCANAWMNAPRGFTVSHGKIVGVNPWQAMFNPAFPPETTHMILAAFMVTGFSMASVYAVAMLRGKHDRYHRLGLLIPLTLAVIITPVQIGVGDWAAASVGDLQPTKLAAMEGLSHTTKGAPEALLGYYSNGELHDAIKIPQGLSLLAKHKIDATVQGLDAVPATDRPSNPLVTVTHLAFDTMVFVGFAFFGLGLWLALIWKKRSHIFRHKWFLRAVSLSGIAAVVAMECGWITTEVGRQPWIVYNVMKVASAVNPVHGIQYGYYALLLVYAILTAVLIGVLRHLAKQPIEEHDT